MSVTCSICLDDLTKATGKTILGCGHEFHLVCITTWLSRKATSTCPYCRLKTGTKDSVKSAQEEDNPSVQRMVRGVTQLMFAASANDANQVNTLLNAYNDVNAVDEDGDSALVYSVSNRFEEVTKILLNAKADLKVLGKLVAAPKTADGALAAAASFYSPSCINALLKMPLTLDGISVALEIATSKNYSDIAYLLICKKQQISKKWWSW